MQRLIFISVILFSFVLLGCNIKQSKNDEWVLIWEENFDKEDIDSNIWSKIPRGQADWNKFMTDYDSCYKIANGNLILRAIPNIYLEDDTAKVLTGGVWSMGKKNFQSGKLEIRAKLDEGQGLWPAIWMLPEGRKWPAGGEIDIMEHLSFDTIVYQTIHTPYTLADNDEPQRFAIHPITNRDYNIYALEFYSDSLRFFTNDKLTLCYPRIDSLGVDQFPFEDNFYIILSNQVGGNWVGEYNINDLPANMYIDWIRFYQNKSDK